MMNLGSRAIFQNGEYHVKRCASPTCQHSFSHTCANGQHPCQRPAAQRTKHRRNIRPLQSLLRPCGIRLCDLGHHLHRLDRIHRLSGPAHAKGESAPAEFGLSLRRELSVQCRLAFLLALQPVRSERDRHARPAWPADRKLPEAERWENAREQCRKMVCGYSLQHLSRLDQRGDHRQYRRLAVLYKLERVWNRSAALGGPDDNDCGAAWIGHGALTQGQRIPSRFGLVLRWDRGQAIRRAGCGELRHFLCCDCLRARTL